MRAPRLLQLDDPVDDDVHTVDDVCIISDDSDSDGENDSNDANTGRVQRKRKSPNHRPKKKKPRNHAAERTAALKSMVCNIQIFIVCLMLLQMKCKVSQRVAFGRGRRGSHCPVGTRTSTTTVSLLVSNFVPRVSDTFVVWHSFERIDGEKHLRTLYNGGRESKQGTSGPPVRILQTQHGACCLYDAEFVRPPPS